MIYYFRQDQQDEQDKIYLVPVILSHSFSNYLATKAQSRKGTQMKFMPLSDREEYID